MIFSPSRKFGDFNKYLEEKLQIEEKLEKYPFRDMTLKEFLKRRRKNEDNMQEVKVNKKAKSTKNVRLKLQGN